MKSSNSPREREESFAILSGKYGLLKPEDEIPYYDKLLREDDVEELVPGVREFLRVEKVSEVVYHTREIRGRRKPYFRLIKKSCEKEDVDLSINKLH